MLAFIDIVVVVVVVVVVVKYCKAHRYELDNSECLMPVSHCPYGRLTVSKTVLTVLTVRVFCS